MSCSLLLQLVLQPRPLLLVGLVVLLRLVARRLLPLQLERAVVQRRELELHSLLPWCPCRAGLQADALRAGPAGEVRDAAGVREGAQLVGAAGGLSFLGGGLALSGHGCLLLLLGWSVGVRVVLCVCVCVCVSL